MAAFFEFRQYRIKDGKRERWVKFMEEKIIPFQVERGMVIVGSWIDPEQPDHYIWMRRFESEDERKALYTKRSMKIPNGVRSSNLRSMRCWIARRSW